MVNVIQYGLGIWGQAAIQLMVRKGFNVVGAIDVKPEYLGKDAGELDVFPLDKKIGVKVTNDVQGVLRGVKADIVSFATVSELDRIYDQMKPFIEAGINVISIAEELAYPWAASPELASEIDTNAKAHNVTVIGTGLNPGFSMDWIPIVFTSACCNVDKIRILSVLDWAPFRQARKPLPRFGVKPQEFRDGVTGKTPVYHHVLHTGCYESMTMISDALGWKLDNISKTWEMCTSRSLRKDPYGLTVEPGTTAGWKHTAIGSIKGEAKIIMDFYCLIHPNLEEDGVEPGDTVWIDGEPSLTINYRGGTAERGDLVIMARMVNIIPAVIDAKPGLISVKDLPLTPPLPDK